jgi:hypothetical protein
LVSSILSKQCAPITHKGKTARKSQTPSGFSPEKLKNDKKTSAEQKQRPAEQTNTYADVPDCPTAADRIFFAADCF